MHNNRFLIVLLFVLTHLGGYSQSDNQYTANEQKYREVFFSFMNYIKIKSNNNLTDSSSLKYVLLNYLFINKKLDTTDPFHFKPNELTREEFYNFKKELSEFYRFFDERQDKLLADNIEVSPIRFSKDKFIYNHMTVFQKANTFTLFDKRDSTNVLGYLLFAPHINKIIDKEKIWSWTLMFRFGKFFFKSATGEEGYEYLFER